MRSNNSNPQNSALCAEPVSLPLGKSLTRQEVDAARRRLSAAIGVASHIILFCQELEKLDGHGLRFLCSAHRYITSRDRTCEFSGLSPTLVAEVSSEERNLHPGFFCNQSNHIQCIWG